MRNMILTCLIASAIACPAFAQTRTDLQILQKAFEVTQHESLASRYKDSQKNPNELQAILSGLFLTYKAVISSQDQNKCNFAPSCSEYGLQAVKQLGILKGVISTLDRLTRCNGLNVKNYTFDPATKRLHDPVKW